MVSFTCSQNLRIIECKLVEYMRKLVGVHVLALLLEPSELVDVDDDILSLIRKFVENMKFFADVLSKPSTDKAIFLATVSLLRNLLLCFDRFPTPCETLICSASIPEMLSLALDSSL